MCVNVIDTVASVDANVPPLQSVISLQAAAVNEGLEQDCARFDAAGVCLSASVRHTETDAPAARSSGVALTAAWRAGEHLRLGAFINSNHAHDTPDAARLRQRAPTHGVFGDWHQREDGLGAGVRAAVSRASGDLTLSRANDPTAPVLGAEPGAGRTTASSLAASLVARWGMALSGTWQAAPYLGLRHTRVEVDGYTERPRLNLGGGEGVSYPLSYAGLDTRRTTALLGLKLDGRLLPALQASVDVGLEHDLDRRGAAYRASGTILRFTSPFTPGIPEPVDYRRALQAGTGKPRGHAGVGLTWQLDQRHSVGARLAYRPGWFDDSHTVSAYLSYTAGF